MSQSVAVTYYQMITDTHTPTDHYIANCSCCWILQLMLFYLHCTNVTIQSSCNWHIYLIYQHLEH